MLTREQIEEIQTESREKGVSIKNILKEKGVPESQYFWWRRKYSKVGSRGVARVFTASIFMLAARAAGL